MIRKSCSIFTSASLVIHAQNGGTSGSRGRATPAEQAANGHGCGDRLSAWPVRAIRAGVLAIAAGYLLCAVGVSAQQNSYTFPNPQPLGSAASASVTVTAQAAGGVSSVQVLTAGTGGLEFADAGGGCTGANFAAAGATCTESVTFTPKYPGAQFGAVVLLGNGGSTVLGTAYLSGTGSGPLGVLYSGEIAPVAGSGEWRVVQNGPALSAGLYLPTSVALDGAGDLYIADSLHHMIRKVDTTQTISTIAGIGTSGYAGDNGPAASATLNTPSGIAVDGAGNLFIADTGNNVVREIVQATGIIKTVAGNGTLGNAGDTGPATSANLNQPLGITVDPWGNLYVADTGNNRIRRVDAVTGVITHVAGDPNGAAGFTGNGGPAATAELNGPNAVAFDANGNMYIPDSLNNVVRMVSGGTISTFAGGGGNQSPYGQPATQEQLNSPSSVVVDAAQNVYIADTQNNAIRKVYPGGGFYTTIALIGVAGGFFDGKTYMAGLASPYGMVRDGSGNLIFADEFNNKIREIQSNKIILDFTFAPTHVSEKSATAGETLENDGNAPLTITSITPDANSAVDATVQNACATGAPGYGNDGNCVIGAQFAPTTTGDPLDAHITAVANSGNSPFDIELVGAAIPPSVTTLTLTATPNPSVFEQSVAFAATVTAAPVTTGNNNNVNPGIPTGTVTFSADGASIGSATLDSTGRATLNYSTLSVGTHVITASYSGDVGNLASTSTPLSQVVQKMPTDTSVGASSGANSSSPALVATVIGVTSNTPVPTGTVTFVSGSTTLGSATLNASGVATFSPQLAAGSYTVVANYGGDAVHAPSSSVAVTITGTPTDFGIGVTPAKITMATGQNSTLTVNITSQQNYADTIGLGCSSLPAGVNCHFSSATVDLKSGGTASVQLTVDTNNPLSGGSSAMNSRPAAVRGLTLAGLFAPAGLFFGFIFRRFRRRGGIVFTAALAIVLSGALMLTGCGGGFTQSSAAPGTYVFQVTGLGVNSNVAHYQPVTLTITK